MADKKHYHEVYISTNDILEYCGKLRKFSAERVDDPLFQKMYEEDWSGIIEMLHELTGFDMMELIAIQQPYYTHISGKKSTISETN